MNQKARQRAGQTEQDCRKDSKMCPSRIVAVLLVALVGQPLAAMAVNAAAETEVSDLPQGIQAKMARYRTKKLGGDEAGGKKSSFLERRSGVVGTCGGLNVGNVSGTGFGRMPREVTVVITGDVINANNSCR
jgi:hypothetical protein